MTVLILGFAASVSVFTWTTLSIALLFLSVFPVTYQAVVVVEELVSMYLRLKDPFEFVEAYLGAAEPIAAILLL